jgi:hypothetical protein
MYVSVLTSLTLRSIADYFLLIVLLQGGEIDYFYLSFTYFIAGSAEIFIVIFSSERIYGVYDS